MPVMIQCEVCPVIFPVKPYRLKAKQKPRFCSAKCMGVAKRLPDEMRDCAFCGEPFPLRRGLIVRHDQLFCSKRCFWRDHARQKIEKAFDRFWGRVEQCGHEWLCPYCCWPWKGATNQGGYGKLTYKSQDRIASRLAWELSNEQEMPPELDAAHWCHVRRCCNPMHIHAATPKVNYGDSIRDGRHIFGSRAGASKLVEEDIPEIFRLRAMGWTFARIAEKFEVHKTTIQFALRRQSWKSVDIDPTFVLPRGRGKSLHPETPQVVEVYQLWRGHKTTRQVAKILGISQATVWRYIRIAQRTPLDVPGFTIKVSTAPERPQIDRQGIYIRDQGVCHICQKKVSVKAFTLDHLIPRIHGGPDIEGNLAVAHPHCNAERFTGRLVHAQLRLF